MASRNALWPPLETGYLDEFGPVDPEVHRVAADLWPRAEHVAIDLIADAAVGFRLLKRAVAAVSGLSPDRREQIRDLSAYLFQTYKRLVLAELEKLNGHRSGDLAAAEILRPAWRPEIDVERQILVAQLIQRLDPWAREVFENLTLGYSFGEIGQALGSNPHVVRNRFRLALRRLATALAGAPARATPEPPVRRKGMAGSIRRLRMMRARLANPSG